MHALGATFRHACAVEQQVKPVSVLLVDDDEDLRLLARLALEDDPRFAVLAEAGNGFHAIAIASDHQPDVVLLDLDMPWLDGAEAVPHLRHKAPDALIAVWTVTPESRRAAEAVELGASTVLDKFSVSPGTLGDHIEKILGGHRRLLDERRPAVERRGTDLPSAGPE